jgi:hypothetical protein
MHTVCLPQLHIILSIAVQYIMYFLIIRKKHAGSEATKTCKQIAPTDDTKNTVTFTVTDSSLVFNEGRESHPIMNRFYCTEDMGAKTLDGIFAFTVAS